MQVATTQRVFFMFNLFLQSFFQPLQVLYSFLSSFISFFFKWNEHSIYHFIVLTLCRMYHRYLLPRNIDINIQQQPKNDSFCVLYLSSRLSRATFAGVRRECSALLFIHFTISLRNIITDSNPHTFFFAFDEWSFSKQDKKLTSLAFCESQSSLHEARFMSRRGYIALNFFENEESGNVGINHAGWVFLEDQARYIRKSYNSICFSILDILPTLNKKVGILDFPFSVV